MKPLIIAHRGASAYAPENTLAAFRLAEQMGCDGLEFDVQLSKDGVPVVIHDEDLQRTTGVKSLVGSLTWKEIQSLDAGAWRGSEWNGEKIPSLELVLQQFSSLLLNIELKNSVIPYAGIEAAVVALLDQYCDPKKVIVSSFEHSSLLKVKELAPHIGTGALYGEEPMYVTEYAAELGVDALHPNFKSLTKEKAEAFKQLGKAVNTWTVNRADDMQTIIQIGADAIITDYPDRLYQIRSEMAAQQGFNQ